MKKFFTERKLNIIISVLAVVVMWIVWIIAYYTVKNDYIIPSFQNTFISLWRDCLAKGAFWAAFGNTFLRTLLAFIISFVIAAALACLCALSKKVSAFIMPFMVFLRTLPTLAVVLLLLIWTNPRVAPVIVTILVLFPMIHARLFTAIDGIDGSIRQMIKVYDIPKNQAVFKIYLPLISPQVIPQVGADISLGLKIMISAEVLASTFKSLGGMMQESRLYLDMPRLAALTLLVVFFGLIVDIAFSQLSRLTYKWSRKEGAR